MEQASALWTYIIGVAWNSHRSGVPYAYGNLEEMDRELTAIIDEIEDIDKKLEFSKNVDAELRKDRNDFMRKVLISMNHLREVVNDGIETEDYDDLLVTYNLLRTFTAA